MRGDRGISLCLNGKLKEEKESALEFNYKDGVEIAGALSRQLARATLGTCKSVQGKHFGSEGKGKNPESRAVRFCFLFMHALEI